MDLIQSSLLRLQVLVIFAKASHVIESTWLTTLTFLWLAVSISFGSFVYLAIYTVAKLVLNLCTTQRNLTERTLRLIQSCSSST